MRDKNVPDGGDAQTQALAFKHPLVVHLARERMLAVPECGAAAGADLVKGGLLGAACGAQLVKSAHGRQASQADAGRSALSTYEAAVRSRPHLVVPFSNARH